MSLFHKKSKSYTEPQTYDAATHQPTIRASICTGEQVAGFKNISTGKFEEDMLIKTPADLDGFMDKYDLTRDMIKKEY